MPPKAAGAKAKGKDDAVKKVNPQQVALEEAAANAEKMYKIHEKERLQAERKEKAQRDFYHLDAAVEKERLKAEKEKSRALQKEIVPEEALAFKEYEKHLKWKEIPASAYLPDVRSEAEINTFLSVWKSEQEGFDHFAPETVVISSRDLVNDTGDVRLRFFRGEQTIPAAQCQKMIHAQFTQCLQAYELAEAIKRSRDVAASASSGDDTLVDFHNTNLTLVYQQIVQTLDFVSVQLLLHYDALVTGAGDGETFTQIVPESNPILKFGFWIKIREMTRSFTSLLFPDIDIRLDPKANTMPKLPKALGLSRENVAVRAVQLSFDPHCGHSAAGKEYYALKCCFKADVVSFSDRPNKHGLWTLRSETAESHTLNVEDYPPRTAEARTEDPAFRISFDIPPTILIRTGTIVVGKWVEETHEWEPTTHALFNAQFAGTSRAEPNPRRATFLTSELAQFALLQEKVYDALYDSWCLRPLSYDQVLFVLEGKRRNDMGDREFRFLLQEGSCKLLAPDDVELAHLRENFFMPTTMFRELAQAGFNFVLSDEDSKYLESVVPKSKALENKLYADMAQFGLFYTFANSIHNKNGEDANMALFRMSKAFRSGTGEEDSGDDGIDNYKEPSREVWHAIRYRKDNCAFSRFHEDEKQPQLDVVEGTETHFNLYNLLLSERDAGELQEQIRMTNFLLRRCIYEVLCIIRPLSWG